MVTPTELEIYFLGEALVLVNPTVVELFYQDLVAKALLLVTPTELEISYQDLYRKALLATVLEIFQQTDDKVDDKVDDNFNKLDTFEPLTSTERLLTVSTPFMFQFPTGLLSCVIGQKKCRRSNFPLHQHMMVRRKARRN